MPVATDSLQHPSHANTTDNSSNSNTNSIMRTPPPSRQKSLTQQDLIETKKKHAELVLVSISSMAAAEDVTMEDVARIMREEDAHLLESMRFEQSCSTGETPVLTSMESNLDAVEDLSLLHHDDADHAEQQHQQHDNNNTASSTSNVTAEVDDCDQAIKPRKLSLKRSVSLEDGQTSKGNGNSLKPILLKSPARRASSNSIGSYSTNNNGESPVVYRQCLSGEIKSFRTPQPSPVKLKTTLLKLPPPPIAESLAEQGIHQDKDVDGSSNKNNGNDEEGEDEEALPEGEETTMSSTCCSHDNTASSPSLNLMLPPLGLVSDASTININSNTNSNSNSNATVPMTPPPVVMTVESEKRRLSSTDRRMNEAVQFVQAVGEMPPMTENELCIIEEDDDDDTDDDDDDDDGNGTVIRLDELGSQMGSIQNDHMSLVDTVVSTTDIVSITGDDKTSNEQIQQQQQQQNQNQQLPPRTPNNNNDIPREIIKRKSRPQWPLQLQLPGWTFSHLDTSVHANREKTVQDFVYKGIRSNPPEIVSRGISRGNHVQLHRKAWLEVSDKYHRYGKNLRLYYRHWESLGFPTNMFFDWLDSKGEAAGQPLPNLEECPRSKLDSDTVLYITNPEVTTGYSLKIVTIEGRAKFLDVDGETVRTGQDGWIFVLRDGVTYGAEKITSINGQSKQRFHHSSFFGGKAVAAAGIFITDEEGVLTRLYPHSGHYRPREAHMQRLLFFLYHQGVDLRTFEMDVQQIMHVCRDTEKDGKKEKKEKKDKKEKALKVAEEKESNAEDNDGTAEIAKKEGEKKKKVDSLQLWPAVSVACYVAHKAHFIGDGIFSQIHQIRNANVATVSEALEHVSGKKPSTTGSQCVTLE